MAPPTKLLVLGGTGFVGREICRRAVKLGFQVTSLSRRGRISPAALKHEWENKVQWRFGSAAHEESLEPLIAQHDAVIHCVGILFENYFNTIVSGCGSHPAGATYEQINMETAFVTLSAIEKRGKGDKPYPFVFVSASPVMPSILKRYLLTKQAVEKRMIQDTEKKLIRGIIFRPGLVYHHSKYSSLPIARGASLAHAFDERLKKTFGFSLGCPEPTPLDLLSTCAVRAIAREDVSGIFANKDMWSLTSPDNPEI